MFMDNVPTGFEAGKDYVSVVSADNYGNGVASAHLMAKFLQGKGQIGLIYHAAKFFVTRQRYEAFKKTITENYPDITIVAEQGIREPDFFKDADRVASVMLTANPNLSGIWAVWDVPAEGVEALKLCYDSSQISARLQFLQAADHALFARRTFAPSSTHRRGAAGSEYSWSGRAAGSEPA